MLKVIFREQDETPDELLKYAVTAARYGDKWIFCRHKERTTWEMPGGHREHYRDGDEDIIQTAMRELYEETGAVEYDIEPLCVYGVEREDGTTYGLLCAARIKTLGKLPDNSEIGWIKECDIIPDELTYPEIQPRLFDKAKERYATRNP